MYPRRFALIGGAIMLAIGLISLIPALQGTVERLPVLNVETSYGLFLGLFPMNIFNKAALIIMGLAGVSAASSPFTSLPMSIHFSRLVFMVMAVLAVLGIIPATNTLFGYWPLFGNEIIFHGVFALVGAYYGYALSAKVRDSGAAVKSFTTPMSGTR